MKKRNFHLKFNFVDRGYDKDIDYICNMLHLVRYWGKWTKYL